MFADLEVSGMLFYVPFHWSEKWIYWSNMNMKRKHTSSSYLKRLNFQVFLSGRKSKNEYTDAVDHYFNKTFFPIPSSMEEI